MKQYPANEWVITSFEFGKLNYYSLISKGFLVLAAPSFIYFTKLLQPFIELCTNGDFPPGK